MRYIKAGRKTGAALLLIMMVMLFCGCGKREQTMNGEGKAQTMQYIQITQEEAQKMMEQDDGHVVVDVRRADEYAEGHIPGAILVPNENIVNTPPEELPDFEQIILVYCRSGRRSKEAAQKLADMGYKKVYEFGGIIDWTGEIETDEESDNGGTGKAAELRFDSFDGGGPAFHVVVEDESIVSYDTKRAYYSPDHDEESGAGYDVVISFIGQKTGETTAIIEERSPIADNLDREYRITVDADLNVQLEEVSVTEAG